MDRFQNTRQPNWDWWGKLWPAPGETLRRLGVTAGEALLEVGSGNGYFALPAARVVDPATVYALDLDEALLEELRGLADQQGVENLVTVHGDARSLAAHVPDPVDVVLVANTFHGVDNRTALVRGAVESLRPDGRLIIINWAPRPREETSVAGEPRGPPTGLRLSPAETETVVGEAAAFARVRQVDLPPHHYGLVFER